MPILAPRWRSGPPKDFSGFLNFGVAFGRELCYPIVTRRWGNTVPSCKMMEWGATRILALRKHAGMTQSRFAQWLGVSVKQVKYLEHQRRNPSGPSRRLLDILADQSRFNGTEGVMVLGAGASHLKPPSDKPKSPAAPAPPLDAAKPLDNRPDVGIGATLHHFPDASRLGPAPDPPPPDGEQKAPAKEEDSAVAVSSELPDDAFVWR